MKKLQSIGASLFPRWINDPCTDALRTSLWEHPMLTFDDVDERAINDILTTLESVAVRSVFFVTGRDVEHNPDLLQRITANGHVLGNHSFNHVDLRTISLKDARNEVIRTQKILSNFEKLRWFRPPYGAISKQLSNWLRGAGYDIVLWSLDSGDWRKGATVEKVVDAVSRAQRDDIVLMHANSVTAKALPLILERLGMR